MPSPPEVRASGVGSSPVGVTALLPARGQRTEQQHHGDTGTEPHGDSVWGSEHVETDVVDIVTVSLPAARVERWVANFESRHGPTAYDVRDGALTGTAADGSTFAARLPFATAYDGPAEPDRARRRGRDAAGVGPAARAQGRVRGGQDVGRGDRRAQDRPAPRPGPHQGGGPEPAAVRPASRQPGPAGLRGGGRPRGPHPRPDGRRGPVVTGGDHAAVDEVLADPRLRGLTVVEPWLPVPDPKRAVLDQAVRDATRRSAVAGASTREPSGQSVRADYVWCSPNPSGSRVNRYVAQCRRSTRPVSSRVTRSSSPRSRPDSVR